MGTGARLEASTCTSPGIPMTLTVFKGTSCGSLSCFASGFLDCGSQASAQWSTIEGEVFYILAQPVIFSDEGPVEGTFELKLTAADIFPTKSPTKSPTPKEDEGGSCNIFLLVLATILRIVTFGLVNLCG
jgi:hypothetical protein